MTDLYHRYADLSILISCSYLLRALCKWNYTN